MIRIRGTQKAVAATTDCNGRYVYLSPRRGAQGAVAEAARNLVCTGALPVAITNNLNFGNPLKPHIYYQFREAVLGMAEACRAFETPVTGGNVSFYNETDGAAIYPTPVIGMVGIVENLDHITSQAFSTPGDRIVLLGSNTVEIGASEYVSLMKKAVLGEPPVVDLMTERDLQNVMLALIREGLVRSAHDCAEGGLACALAESALGADDRPLGVDVELSDALPPVAVLFGEAHGRIVISCAPENVARITSTAAMYEVPCAEIGTVGDGDSTFRIRVGESGVDVDLDTLAETYFGALPGIMDRVTSS